MYISGSGATPSPVYTPLPTYTPFPTYTPPPVVTPSTPPPNVGRLEITYPHTMEVEEADVVSIEIIIDPRLVQTGTFPANATGLISIEERSQNGTRRIYESEIKLYPVMTAELQAQSFDFSNTNSNTSQRVIATGEPIGWVWNVVAKKPGEQSITVSIYGEGTQNGVQATYLAHATSLNVIVVDKSFLEKIFAGFTNNIVTVLGTGGPLGLIIAYLTYRMNRNKQELLRQIEASESEKRELHRRIEILESNAEEKRKQKQPAKKKD